MEKGHDSRGLKVKEAAGERGYREKNVGNKR